VLTLGLVTGANGTIFSVLEAVLLRPLSFPSPAQLVFIFGSTPQSNRAGISIPDLEEFRRSASLSALTPYEQQSVNLTGVQEPDRLIGGFVSSAFFAGIGVHPVQGRGFNAADDKPGAERVCIISHPVWRDRFGSDPHALERTIILNAEPYTVIGVLAEGFTLGARMPEVWMPVQFFPNYATSRERASLFAVGRLKDGVTLQRARTELNAVAGRLAVEYPETNRDRRVIVESLHESLIAGKRNPILVLWGAVGCVLLIGCANIAGLLLTRLAGRTQEVAIRASLGAGSGRLVRQLLTECLLLAFAGGLAGTVLAYGGSQLISAYAVEMLAGAELTLNWKVLSYLFFISVATGILFGIAPASLARRQRANALRQRGAAIVRTKLRGALVTAQVALALVLMTGSGLMVKSLGNLMNVDPGFRGEHVLTMEYRLPENKYSTGALQTRFHQEAVARVSAIPGVESATIVGGVPFSGNSNTAEVTFPDRPAPSREAPFVVQTNTAAPGYFRTAGIPLLAGRDFSRADVFDSARVAIVSSSFAARFWPGKDPLGRLVRIGSAPPATIIGVVGGTKLEGIDDIEMPQIYSAYAQTPFRFATLAVKTKGDPMAMTKEVQRAIWSVDKDQPMWKIRSLQYLIDRSWSYRRYVMVLLGCFSVLALGLAAIGLYGVLACGVSQRIGEFGIRMAVGAPPRRILSLVICQGMLLTAFGLLLGLASAVFLTQYLRSQLYLVSTTDPAVYAVVSALLLAVALFAVLLPACRAMRIDPAIALRHE
jgi:putative ABC transport system permease protein